MISRAVTAALGLALIVVLFGSKSRLPDSGSQALANHPTSAFTTEGQERLLELELLQPSELAFAEPELARPVSPSMAKTSRETSLDKALVRAPVATPLGSSNSVAPSAVAPLAVDPLERRK